MDNFFDSKKYIILLIIVCLLFTIMTVKFFDYIPKPLNNQELEEYQPYNQNSEQDEQINNVSESVEDFSDDDQDDEDEDEDENDENDENENAEGINEKSGHIDYMPQSSFNNNVDFVEIPAPNGTNEETIQVYDTN